MCSRITDKHSPGGTSWNYASSRSHSMFQPEFAMPWLDHTEVLSSDEEKLVVASAQSGDTQAIQRLTLSCARFAKQQARLACRRAYELHVDEVFSEAILGVMEAIKTFDSTRGVKFSTHAYWDIQKRIRNFVKSQQLELYVPQNKRAGMLKENSKLRANLNGQDVVDKEDKVSEPYRVDAVHAITSISIDSVDSDTFDIAAVDESAILGCDAQKLIDILDDFLLSFPERDSRMYKMHYGIPHGEGTTFAHIARVFGVSRQLPLNVIGAINEKLKRRAHRDTRLLDFVSYLDRSPNRTTV